MAENYKILGQSNPAATTLTDIYTVPANAEAVVSTIVICNTTSSNSKIRVAVAIAGAGDILAQYLLYDIKVLRNDTLKLTIGMSLSAADVIRAFSDITNVAFNVFGTEIT